MDHFIARLALAARACILLLLAAGLTTSSARAQGTLAGGYSQADFDREYQETAAQLVFWLNRKCLDQTTIDALTSHADAFIEKWYPLGSWGPNVGQVNDEKSTKLEKQILKRLRAEGVKSISRRAIKFIESLRDALQKHKCPPPRLSELFEPAPAPWQGRFFQWSVGMAGGVTNSSRDGSLVFHDVITGETDTIGQSGSDTFATLGLIGTVSTPLPLSMAPGMRGFLETGILFHTVNHQTASFTNFSGNLATGQTSTEERFSIPLLAGLAIPVQDFGIPAPNVALQLKAGGMIDNRKATVSFFEVTPDLVTSASVTKTQINPAVGVGLLYQPMQSPFSFGVQAIFDFQQPIRFTTQSAPFPSAFYTTDTGHQTSTTVLLEANVALPPDRVFLNYDYFSRHAPPPP